MAPRGSPHGGDSILQWAKTNRANAKDGIDAFRFDRIGDAGDFNRRLLDRLWIDTVERGERLKELLIMMRTGQKADTLVGKISKAFDFRIGWNKQPDRIASQDHDDEPV